MARTGIDGILAAIVLAAMLAAAGVLILASPASAAPGDLDPTFSDDGKQTTDFGGGDTANDVAIQSDGKIVAVGETEGGRQEPTSPSPDTTPTAPSTRPSATGMEP